jgi:hypothetical protein
MTFFIKFHSLSVGPCNTDRSQSALTAKMGALFREFDALQDSTSEIPWCKKVWWKDFTLEVKDWIILDSWYRSRCLELPVAGESMVPVLDMANHSTDANCHYQQSSNGNVILLLRPGININTDDELTINYGSEKSAAEMLFSYGFIDQGSNVQSLVLPFLPSPEDPLAKAKLVAFGQTPTLKVEDVDGSIKWSCPFIYLSCLNEEDGLEFRTLLETDGTQSQLKVFWQDKDVTGAADKFEELIMEHSLKDVFMLRAVALVQARVQAQLESLYDSEDLVSTLMLENKGEITQSVLDNARLLRWIETDLLERCYEVLDAEVFARRRSNYPKLTGR